MPERKNNIYGVDATGKRERSFNLSFEKAKGDDTDERRIKDVSFSSEVPYERFFGEEILGHKKSEIIMERMKSGLSVFYNHDWDRQLGTLENARIVDGKIRGDIFFSDSDFAREKKKDVDDGILKDVSVGYFVHEMKLVSEKDGKKTYRVTRWDPYEVSLATVAADISVGVGRSLDKEEETQTTKEEKGGSTMPKEIEGTKATPQIDIVAETRAAIVEARKAEITRISEITARGAGLEKEKLAQEYIKDGGSVSDFNKAVLDDIAKTREQLNPEAPIRTQAEIGLTKKEAQAFSIIKGVRALLNRSWKGAEFEKDASDAVAKKLGRDATGFYVPFDVQKTPLKRDLSVGVDTAGGYLVGTEQLAMVQKLDNIMKVRALGATILSGLEKEIDIPRQTSGATAYWVGEGANVTESQQAFDQLRMSPKTIGALTEVTRKLIIQGSPDVEALIRNDLMLRLALGIDLASLHGTGADGQPLGIAGTSGIGSVAGGTNGLAPTWAHMMGLKKEVNKDNALMGNLGYLTNADVEFKLETTLKDSGVSDYILSDEGKIGRYRTEFSNQVSNTLTKGTSSGVCSAVFFGNWADLIIGEWGTLDINIDTSTLSASGGTRIVALKDVDIIVRRPQSFAAMLDALTV